VKREYVTEKNYRYHEAGRIWLVKALRFTKLPDGALGLSQAEINRVHRAIANEVCGDERSLTGEEFEFLCAVAAVTFTEVAGVVHIDRSTLTKWRDAGKPMPVLRSLFLKRWFWFKLFGEGVAEQSVPLRALQDDVEFLRIAHDTAIRENLTESILRAVA